MRVLYIPVLVSAFAVAGVAQPPDTEQKVYQTARTDTPPEVDGIISDSVWTKVDWGTGFTQRSPYDGEAPTQETSFKILYDDRNIYIAFRCHDTDPEKIVSRMSRRDGFAGDWVEVNIDSYNDKRTAFSFTSSVSGVKGDEFVTNDGDNWDTSWDPIWTTRTNIDSLGWTCEVEIPLSQLRYSNAEEQTWGIQFTRRDFRNESRSVWQYLPANAGYWVSGFGKLEGIRGIKAKRQVEIQPYVLAQLETYKEQPGNPFADGTDAQLDVGLDGKIGITSDLTLDFTVNPDFGQVEADPSVLTLDGFRIFFEEKRPFFIENRNLFSYNITEAIAGGSFNSDNLFYSRRIGARPHRSVPGDAEAGIYVDQPEFTTILGAAKVSGKTRNGLSVGILEAVTQKERAIIRDGEQQHRELVEPLTNYFVGRLTQDFNDGNTIIGGILTHVRRDLGDTELDFLHTSALTGGVDFVHRWEDRAWQLDARFTFSRVGGSEEAIRNTQNAFEHNFQRPDASHLDYDPKATELTGTGGNIAIAETRGKFRFQTGATWRSPGLELNDIGFMLNSDEISHYYWMSYWQNEPKGIFREYQLNYNHWSKWDFGGNNVYRAVNVNATGFFTNYWRAGTGITYENLDISNNWLRGGPAYHRPSGYFHQMWVETDSRKSVRFNLFFGHGNAFESRVEGQEIELFTRIQPSDAFNFSIGPGYNRFGRDDQYVTTRTFNGEKRYILAEVLQRTVSMTLRFNYNITPDLTIQYYGQPFLSRGTYKDFNRVQNPLAYKWENRVAFYTPGQITLADDTYSIDEDLDGITDYSFADPDFHFVQFRSNLVARWEYIPGSEIFLVWTQNNTFNGQPQGKLLSGFGDDLFSDELRNTFLVKLTYRFLNR